MMAWFGPLVTRPTGRLQTNAQANRVDWDLQHVADQKGQLVVSQAELGTVADTQFRQRGEQAAVESTVRRGESDRFDPFMAEGLDATQDVPPVVGRVAERMVAEAGRSDGLTSKPGQFVAAADEIGGADVMADGRFVANRRVERGGEIVALVIVMVDTEIEHATVRKRLGRHLQPRAAGGLDHGPKFSHGPFANA